MLVSETHLSRSDFPFILWLDTTCKMERLYLQPKNHWNRWFRSTILKNLAAVLNNFQISVIASQLTIKSPVLCRNAASSFCNCLWVKIQMQICNSFMLNVRLMIRWSHEVTYYGLIESKIRNTMKATYRNVHYCIAIS